MKTYFDSSAFARGYIAEPGSELVEDLLRDSTVIASSVICLPEVFSALCRHLRDQNLSTRDYRFAKALILEDFRDVQVIQITDIVLNRTVAFLEAQALRAADAIHLASASAWEAELFVSADDRQLTAARALGLECRAV